MTALTENLTNRNGRSTAANVIVSTSPATGRVLGEVPVTPLEAIGGMMEAARRAQPDWLRRGQRYRAEMLRNIKNALHRNFDLMINTISAEQGKPPFEVLTEIWPTLELLAFYARRAAGVLAPRKIPVSLVPHRMHWVERRPFGVALVIAPWNFPLLLPAAPIAAALVTGNTVIFKPSEFTPQTGELLARIIWEAGVPPDVFQIAHGAGDVGAALIRAKPDKISFTGSVATGRKIAAAAGELLIPVTLELGAKDAAIVLEDADLDRAARGIAWGALHNAGQACLSIERVYVARKVTDRFIQKLVQVIEKEIRVGPGETPETTMGAITTEPQVKIIESQVQEAVAQGANVVIGGCRLDEGNRRYYLPTVLTNVTPEMRVVRDETFGPIIPVIPFDSEEEAIRQTNASGYGLTGSVWTRDRARGLRIAAQLEVGHAGVNDHIISASVPLLPWGGTKDSGYGTTRGLEGMLEMTRPQSFSIERFSSVSLDFLWYPYTPLKYNLLRRFLRALYAPTLFEKLRILFSGG